MTSRAPRIMNNTVLCGRDPQDTRVEPGSFRDRDGRVFYVGEAIYRGLSQQALSDWQLLSSKPFFRRLIDEEKLIQTEFVEANEATFSADVGEWAGFLAHSRIPFISYPYEWPFGMLKDAALLQLELLTAALDEDMILKDASAFNVQWQGSRPVFIDIPSFQALAQGEPWTGYRQFCRMFLYPLFLQAYKDVGYHPWLRGSIDGIDVEECCRLMSLRDVFRPGVFSHLYLQARLQASYAMTQRDIKRELRAAGFSKELLQANARRLAKLVEGLTWRKSRSTWSDYANNHSYTDDDHDRKKIFVQRVVHTRHWQLVWDLGCNTGTFSRIAAANADYVIASDADHLAVEQLYQTLKAEGDTSILPLVQNLTEPSPSLGWRLHERKSLLDRGTPDLTLCLALIHHVVIGANIPLREFIDWLASLGTDLIIEFVLKEDPMVKRLLRNKTDNYTDYDQGYFEYCLAEAFDIELRELLTSGTRCLYFAKNKRK